MSEAEEVLRDAAKRLRTAGVPEPMRDARKLLDHAAGRSVRYESVPAPALKEFETFIARRCRREPVSHILGRRAFWHHEFEVSAAVLDPRPETEVLVEAALRAPFEALLDLGTGSGAIVLSLLAEREGATALATDVSDPALEVAGRNAARLGLADRVQFRQSDWFAQIRERFDLIVSNPPYIASAEMADLGPELSFEPRIALTDEADGVSAYRTIAAGALAHLAPGGRVLVEVGAMQGKLVCALFEAAGLCDVDVLPDLDGRDRVVVGCAP